MIFKIAEKHKHAIGIYQWKNLLDNEIYVGKTGRGFRRRFNQHLYLCKKGSLDCPYLYNAMRKYEIENFEFSILEIADVNITDKELKALEQKYIDLLKPKYNVALLAGSNLGCKHRNDAKTKLMGKDNFHAKTIIQYSLEGIKIQEFDSISEAERVFNGLGHNNISRCCRGLRQQAYNYRWAYKGKKLKKINQNLLRKTKKVFIKNKYIYMEFNSQKECADNLNVVKSMINYYIKKGFSNKHNVEIGVVN